MEAETQGNMVLKVKIGNSEPIEMELDGKLKVKFPYNVSEPTYVYIYGGMGAAGAKAAGGSRAKSAADLLKKVSGVSAGQVVNVSDTAQITADIVHFNGPFGEGFRQRLLRCSPRKVIIK